MINLTSINRIKNQQKKQNSTSLEPTPSLIKINRNEQPISNSIKSKPSINMNNNLIKALSFLTLQYKLLTQYGPVFGIYAMPSINDYFIWNVQIIVREGYYKGFKANFQITFDHILGKQILGIKILNPVYHALIDRKTGELDLKTILKIATVNKNPANSQHCQLFPILKCLYDIFHQCQYLSYMKSFNPCAVKTFQSSQDRFIQKIFQSIIQQEQKLNLFDLDSWIGGDQFIGVQQDEQEILTIMKDRLSGLCLQKNGVDQLNLQQKVNRYFQFLNQL